MRSLLTRVLPLAVAFAVALGGPPAEAQSPFAGGARIAVNEAGQAVVAWRSVGGVRAVVGDKIASRLVEIQASSRITLSASGRSLSGTVAPAQPGRSIDIQRQTEGGDRRDVPLTAGGTVFSLVVDQPGAYRAELHSTPAVGPLSYGGQSDEATVSP